MPQVASDFGAIHAPSHHHGTRSHAAKPDGVGASSAFSDLVDAAADDPTPTHISEHGGRSGAVDHTPPAKDGSQTAAKAADGKSASTNDTRTEGSASDADGAATESQTETAAGLQISLAADEATRPTTETDTTDSDDTATDDKTPDADGIQAAMSDVPVDTTPQAAPAPSLAEPGAAVVPPSGDVPVAPAEDATADDAVTTPAQAKPARADATADPAAADAATQSVGKGAGHSEKTQGAAKGGVETSKPADEPADADAASETDSKQTDASTSAPTSSPKPEHAPVRATPGRSDHQKTEVTAKHTAGAEVSEAARGAQPPAQAVHAVLLANDQPAAATHAAAAPSQSPVPDTAAVPLAGLAVEIASRAQAGNNRFEIRLDPPELGRIDVRLDIDTSGNVTSRLVVDRAETLDVLRRDAHQLERALQDAGLKTSDNGLQFSLRDQGMAGRDGSSDHSSTARLVVSDPELAAAPAETLQAGYGRLLRAGGGVDIRI